MRFEFIATDNGGYNDGDPPLPIPNREVKPISADDTAIPSGKVGSRQLIETFSQKWLEVFFLCGIASCPLLPLPSLLCCTLLTLPPSYNAILLMSSTLPPSSAAILLMPSTLPPSYATTLLMPSNYIHCGASIFCGLSSPHFTSVACSSGSPDKSDHRQTWNVDKNGSLTNSVGEKIYLLWNSQTPPTLFRKHSERGWPLLWNNFAS